MKFFEHIDIVQRLICRVPLWYRMLFPGARWRIPGKKQKAVYLTFDDGPIPEVTPWVLDQLDTLGVKATFFCVGDNVQRYPELFQEIKDRGHIVGNHSFHHVQGLKMSTKKYIEDIQLADRFISSRYYRPPHGHMRFSQVLRLMSLYDIIMWDIITRDYNSKITPEKILHTVKRYVRNGSIIVFHDSIKSEKNMKMAMPEVVRFLLSESYKFYTIAETPE